MRAARRRGPVGPGVPAGHLRLPILSTPAAPAQVGALGTCPRGRDSPRRPLLLRPRPSCPPPPPRLLLRQLWSAPAPRPAIPLDSFCSTPRQVRVAPSPRNRPADRVTGVSAPKAPLPADQPAAGPQTLPPGRAFVFQFWEWAEGKGQRLWPCLGEGAGGAAGSGCWG
ncbi:cyclin-dependent kinase inhibitor 1C-like isoform X3 [Vulpes lagopus]|uniref:cyclin-dependent kinase inhibitor 1C-like isoform X3 n=1 Tax=Vulpes lagopus TaxID=494514 RepID=UPI001BC9F109|nr:cyclin-dependent kinase inhibitor 1C-like isoform X3 [Vulpes lagopus]